MAIGAECRRPRLDELAGTSSLTSTAVTLDAGEPCQSQPAQRFDRRVRAAGQHFDAAIGQVARVARDTELAARSRVLAR